MKPLLERLKDGDTLVGDGAIGTMLQQEGLEPGACPESVNLARPELLEQIAGRYLQAGADIIQTNTFGASPAKLASYGLEERTEEINRNAVQAVRKVVGDRAYVAGSCGPSGKILRPYGDAEPDELYAGFSCQIAALVEAGVDCLCIETMIDLGEATLAISAARAVAPETPILATMTFDETPRGFFTIMGTSPAQATAGLQEAGADVVGSNCGNGIENMIRIARELRDSTHLPLIIQSNAGLPEMQGGVPVYGETPAFMAEKARDLLAIGVSIIGGCCGTTPEHIKAIRNTVDSSAKR